MRDVKAEYAWTGTLGNTVHRMPQIGEISPGLWLLSGFGGHGLNTTAMGGEMIARAIVEGDQSWQLFSPFELVWAGGMFGRAMQQAYYWSYRARERLASKLARRREAERRRIEEEVRAAVAALGEPVAAPTMAVEVPAAPKKRRRWLPRLSRQVASESGPSAELPPHAVVAPPPAERLPATAEAAGIEPAAAAPAQPDEAAASIAPPEMAPVMTEAALQPVEAVPQSAELSPPNELLPPVEVQPVSSGEMLPSRSTATERAAPTEASRPSHATVSKDISLQQRRRWLRFLSRRAPRGEPGLAEQTPPVPLAEPPPSSIPIEPPAPVVAQEVVPAAALIEPETVSPAQTDETRSATAAPEAPPPSSEPSPLPAAEAQPPMEMQPADDAPPAAPAEVASPLPTPAEPPVPAKTQELQPGRAPAQQGAGRQRRRRWLPFLSRAADDRAALSDQPPRQAAVAPAAADVTPAEPLPAPAPERTPALPSAEQIEPAVAAPAESELTTASQSEAILQTDAPAIPPADTQPSLRTGDVSPLLPDEPAFLIEPPPPDAPPQADVQPASAAEENPPPSTPSEASAVVEAQPKAAAAPAPKSNSPQQRRRWFARLSRRKSSDEPQPPTPDRSSERSAG